MKYKIESTQTLKILRTDIIEAKDENEAIDKIITKYEDLNSNEISFKIDEICEIK